LASNGPPVPYIPFRLADRTGVNVEENAIALNDHITTDADL
jgi:hypothetical protein